MIYDTVLNITWLQDANYAYTSGYDCCDIYGGCDGDQYCEVDGSCDENFTPDRMTWQHAVKWADQTTRWAAWAVRDGDVGDVHCWVPPQNLTGLTATVRQDTVYLSWDESEGATQYNICWSIDGNDFIRLADVHETSYEDPLGSGWSTIDYSVVAVNTCGKSQPSEVVQIKNTKVTGGGNTGGGNGGGKNR